jgi:ElaB/YqjD/DUF883 family membrane-anchored ribosome-binding protein
VVVIWFVEEISMDKRLEHLLDEMKQVVGRTEALLAEGGDKLGDARTGFASRLVRARDLLSDLEHEAARHARRASREVDRYAHDKPWQVAGLGVTIGLIVGVLIGALTRRD